MDRARVRDTTLADTWRTFRTAIGLGWLVLTASQTFDTASLWVGVFILAGAGILSVVILQKVERRMAPWRQFELK